MSRRLRRGLALGGAGLVVVAAVALPSAGAAGFAGTFKSFAAADGVRATLVMPGVTVTKSLVDVGAPSAQAALNSLGESRAFGSIPYPGDTAVTGPGTVAGATNGQVNVPGYPLYAFSDHPAQPRQEVGDGPMAMRAESNETSSSGSASAGLRSEGIGELGLSRAAASIASEGEAVTARAATEISSFSVGPLEIAQIVSAAEAVFDQAGRLTRKADTRIIGASIAGTPFQLSPAGFTAGTDPTPPPDLKPLNEALKPAGFTIEIVPATETDTGVVAPAVRISQDLQQGSRLVYQLGSATVSVEGAAEEGGGVLEGDLETPGAAGTPDPAPAAGTPAAGSGSAESAPSPAGGSGPGDAGTATFPEPEDVIAPSTFTAPASTPGPASASAPGTYPAVSPPDPGPAEAAGAPGAAPSFSGNESASPGTGGRSASDRSEEGIDAVPVLATRLLDAGDSRPFYAAFIVAAIVGLAGVIGVALFSRALRSGAP